MFWHKIGLRDWVGHTHSPVPGLTGISQLLSPCMVIFIDVKLWTNGFWGTLFSNNSTCLLFPVLLYWWLQSPCWTYPPAPIISFYTMVQYGSNHILLQITLHSIPCPPSIERPNHPTIILHDINLIFQTISTYTFVYQQWDSCVISYQERVIFTHLMGASINGGTPKWIKMDCL